MFYFRWRMVEEEPPPNHNGLVRKRSTGVAEDQESDVSHQLHSNLPEAASSKYLLPFFVINSTTTLLLLSKQKAIH